MAWARPHLEASAAAGCGTHACSPAGVACDGVPALVLIDVDAPHVRLWVDVPGAAGQAWGEQAVSTQLHLPAGLGLLSEAPKAPEAGQGGQAGEGQPTGSQAR